LYFQSGQIAEAFQSWRAAAMSGDGRAALYLGALYDTGIGVEQDYVRALDWYRRAAEGGDATAMFNVAVMYDSGRGVPADQAAAAQWYGRAAAKRYGRAEYNLALLYEAGSGVARDQDRAVELYRSAARDGISAARLHLAQLGVRSAEEDPAQKELGRDDIGMRDFERAERILLSHGAAEAAKAAAAFRRAADQGNALAQYDLGYCYEHGIGAPADPSQAIAWYLRAAANADDPDIRRIAEAGARALRAQVSEAGR
jgi:TPR repeat protein